jgi:hypothetical protein
MPADSVTFPLSGPASRARPTRSTSSSRTRRRVTQAIARLALQRFYVDRIFAPPVTITGGAVIYDQATANDLYATRDVQRVEPGASSRSSPSTAASR